MRLRQDAGDAVALYSPAVLALEALFFCDGILVRFAGVRRRHGGVRRPHEPRGLKKSSMNAFMRRVRDPEALTPDAVAFCSANVAAAFAFGALCRRACSCLVALAHCYACAGQGDLPRSAPRATCTADQELASARGNVFPDAQILWRFADFYALQRQAVPCRVAACVQGH